jgi:hypothetical protein
MCMGGLRPGCRELHASELRTRPQRAGQMEAEVFLAADQASAPRGGGGNGLSPWAGGVTQSVELVRMRLAVALNARVYAIEGLAVGWIGCEWER